MVDINRIFDINSDARQSYQLYRASGQSVHVRNVMVKVKDTESFIAAARAVHGDKYDYSQTEYIAAARPITIICRNCGPFVLAEAGSHYWVKKACGCRYCERRESLDRSCMPRCPSCGCIKYKGATGLCRKCQPKKQPVKYAIREDARLALLHRPCKNCGKPINSLDKRQVVCSRECGHKGRSLGKVEVPCLICGKTVVRYKREADKFAGACCSLGCQRQWSLSENRGRYRKPINWDRRSALARRRYRVTATKARRRSRFGEWIPAVHRELSRVGSAGVQQRKLVDEDPWRAAITLRLGAGKHRISIRRQVGGPCDVYAALEKVASRRYWYELPEWDKKIINRFSNIRKRRIRKENAKKQTSGYGVGQAGVQWVQVCFNWMEDNPAVL